MKIDSKTLAERLSLSKLVDFCRARPIRKLWAFGSVTGDWRSDSDIDLLVEFLPGKEPDLLGVLELEDELRDLLGRKVDLVERDDVENPYRIDSILATRQQIYAA